MTKSIEKPSEEQIKKIWYALRSKIKRKEMNPDDSFTTFNDFKSWYLSKYDKVPECHYCGIPEPLIEKIYWNTRKTKRPKTRTRLELERKEPNGNYNRTNVILACMACNNAKSDIFTYDEFICIGKEIKRAWKALAKEENLL